MPEFVEKFKKAFGFADEDYYDYNEEETLEEVPHEVKEKRVTTNTSHNSRSKKTSNVLNLKATDLIITVHEPLTYEESPNIVDDLREFKAVVLNFEQLDLEVKRQIFDFVSGALYALDGRIQKVNKDIFVLAPSNVEIDGIKEELKNTGMFPW